MINNLSKEYQTRKPAGTLTPSQIKKLDRLVQELGLRNANYKSVLGGKAVVIHHFFGRENRSTRWYRPNHIPLTHEQHDSIGKKEEIIRIKGEEWYNDLMWQAQKIAKGLNYNKIVDHLLDKEDNYL